jgi:cell division protein FtsZ
VFVTAGLGGGTGSGAAPIVAASARDHGALTIAVVTKPFGFEGSQRKRIADAAAAELAANVDALIIVPNDRVGDVLPADASMTDAFGAVDIGPIRGTRILDLITAPGLINLDFADVRSVMEDAGPALIGTVGQRRHRAADAARRGDRQPAARGQVRGRAQDPVQRFRPTRPPTGRGPARGRRIREHADDDANIIFGASFSESLGEDVLVTLIATGLDGNGNGHAPAPGAESAVEKPPRKRQASKATPPPSIEPVAPVAEGAPAAPPSPATAAEEPVTPSPAATDEAAAQPIVDEEEIDVPSFLRRRR